MHQSISKKRIYFYLFILLILSSTFNFDLISNFKNLNLVNNINIVGIGKKEANIIEKNLEIFKKKNILFISKDEVVQRLNSNTFLDNYNIVKILPSKLLVKVNKTEFIGTTLFNGEKFYIGKNGKLTKVSFVEKEFNLPKVFGNFQVIELLKLQKVLKLNNFNLNKIIKYSYFKSNRWDIEFDDKTIIMLPSFNFEKSLQNYKSFIKKNEVKSGQLIDLRIRDKIIISNVER